MKKIFIIVLSAFMMFGFTADNEVITVKGSDTMVILAQRWAEVYMGKHPNVSVQVTGGGSGVGISALIKDDFQSGLTVGFVTGVPSAIDLYIQESDLKEAETILNEFAQDNQK